MKSFILVLFCLSSLCTLKAQDKNILGTWNLISWANIGDAGSEKRTEDQLKAENQSTLYIFLAEGKFKITTNMSGSGTMEDYDGTWKTSDKNLTITLKVGDQTADLENTYEIRHDTLILTRDIPQQSIKIINTFRKQNN
jgi:hypothetical protein